MSAKKKEKNQKKEKKKRGVFRWIFLILILFIVAVGLGGYLTYTTGISTPRDPDKKAVQGITIRDGESISEIASQLKKDGIISSVTIFKMYTRINGLDSSFQAGDYALSPSMTMEEISKIIISGKTNVTSVTIPEGFTEYDVADRLAKLGLVDKESFIDTLEKQDFTSEYPFLSDAQEGEHRLEGYLFPSTYAIRKEAGNDEIIESMLEKYNKTFSSSMKTRAEELGYSENDIIIIASIIEKEAAADQDRTKIASVIYNRLKSGMKLQMDSTIQYALGLKKARKKDLTISDTKLKSEYNTYKRKGLPYGPICSPGKASIMAALYPDDTDYMYFILSSKLDGTMTFSKDYNKFLKDKAAYYKARDKADKESNS